MHILLKHTRKIIQDRSHIISQKSINKFNKVGIISIISFNNRIKLLIQNNNIRKMRKFTFMWKLSNILLIKHWIKE